MERLNNWALLVKPTHACNLNCKYCFDKPRRDEYKNAKMSFEILDRILELSSNYAKNVNLVWHGGEPTLMGTQWYKDAQEMIYKYYGTIFEQSMQTNGILLDEEWAKLSKNHKIDIGMSFDVLSQNVRLGTGKANLLEKANIFGENGLSLGTISVINSENYDKQIEIYNILKDNGFNGIAFNHIYRAKGTVENGLELDIDKYIEELEKFFRYVIYDKSSNAIEERTVTEAIKLVIGSKKVCCSYNDCRLDWIGVSPDGSVYPCDRYVPKKYYMGNIMDVESIQDLYNSQGFKAYYFDVEKRFEDHCHNCKYFLYCSGGCNGNHIAVSGDASGIDEATCNQLKRRFNLAYDILRDIDIFDLNKHYVEVLLNHPGFTISEIKAFLIEKGYNIQNIFDHKDIKNIGEKLFDLDEYKIFRIFNEFKGKVNGHIDTTSYGLNFRNDDKNSIINDRHRIMEQIYKDNKDKLEEILGGVEFAK